MLRHFIGHRDQRAYMIGLGQITAVAGRIVSTALPWRLFPSVADAEQLGLSMNYENVTPPLPGPFSLIPDMT